MHLPEPEQVVPVPSLPLVELDKHAKFSAGALIPDMEITALEFNVNMQNEIHVFHYS